MDLDRRFKSECECTRWNVGNATTRIIWHYLGRRWYLYLDSVGEVCESRNSKCQRLSRTSLGNADHITSWCDDRPAFSLENKHKKDFIQMTGTISSRRMEHRKFHNRYQTLLASTNCLLYATIENWYRVTNVLIRIWIGIALIPSIRICIEVKFWTEISTF